jgi:hypothetical protein
MQIFRHLILLRSGTDYIKVLIQILGIKVHKRTRITSIHPDRARRPLYQLYTLGAGGGCLNNVLCKILIQVISIQIIQHCKSEVLTNMIA